MEVGIREIQTSDYPQVLSLWNNELGNHSVNAENIALDYERMSKNDEYKTFVALLENNVVGFITTVRVLAVGLKCPQKVRQIFKLSSREGLLSVNRRRQAL